MDNLRAAICARSSQTGHQHRPLERALSVLDTGLRGIPGCACPSARPTKNSSAARSSSLSTRSRSDRSRNSSRAAPARGVDIKWFGDDEPKAYTSRYDSWLYLDDVPALPRTLAVLSKTCDMRVPLTFDEDDCETIVEIIADEVARIHAATAA